MKFSISSSK